MTPELAAALRTLLDNVKQYRFCSVAMCHVPKQTKYHRENGCLDAYDLLGMARAVEEFL